MRRRRRHLEVSTFPFLAVLLCTMGSLILLLLALDRRAKIAAVQKAAAALRADDVRRAEGFKAQGKVEEEERRRLEAEWEQKRQQLHALLAQQEEDLLGQIQDARSQVAAADAKLQNELTRAAQQKNQLHFASANLAGLQQSLKTQEEAATKAGQQTEAARRELERQAAALQQLEQTLAALKLLRERQKNTYSLVPYLGRRGDNRRPIYVECSAAGLIFHPNEVALEGFQLTGDRLRAEVEKRIAGQPPPSAGLEPQRPYLLMLVRPDGIKTYYRAQDALAGMKLEFGYEFIDPDWVLDFSAEQGDGPRQPWMATAKLPGQMPPPPAPPPRPVGNGFAAIPQVPGSGATGGSSGSAWPGGTTGGTGPVGSASSNGAVNGGWPAAPGLPKGVAGGGGSSGFPGNSQGGGSASGSPIGSPRAAGSGGLASSVQGTAAGGWQPSGTPGNVSPGYSAGSPTMPDGLGGKRTTSDSDKVGPSSAANASGVPATPGGTPSGPGASGPQAAANQSGNGPQPGNAAGVPRSPATAQTAKGVAAGPNNGTGPGGGGGSGTGGSSGDGTPCEGGSGGGPGSGSAVLGSPVAPAGKNAVITPPLGRILANRDWPIYIECTANGVTVKQGGEKFTIDVLAAPTRAEHPLAQTLKQMIARRQATVRAGEPPYRPLLRFQVRPDGMRAYYLAYPLLDGLRLPMARENLEALR